MQHKSNILYTEDILLNNRSKGYFPKKINSGNKTSIKLFNIFA